MSRDFLPTFYTISEFVSRLMLRVFERLMPRIAGESILRERMEEETFPRLLDNQERNARAGK